MNNNTQRSVEEIAEAIWKRGQMGKPCTEEICKRAIVEALSLERQKADKLRQENEALKAQVEKYNSVLHLIELLDAKRRSETGNPHIGRPRLSCIKDGCIASICVLARNGYNNTTKEDFDEAIKELTNGRP